MAVQRQPIFITPEEYLEHERTTTSDVRSEYISGEVFAMASPSKRHGEIITNLGGELRSLLRSTPCQANVGVSVFAPASFLVPDVVVYCDGGDFTGQSDILQNPILIFEVLSPSTSAFDRGHKWMRYQQIESLMHYILVSQDEPVAEMFTRDPGGWRYTIVTGLDSKIRLMHVDCELTLAAIYERVAFDG